MKIIKKGKFPDGTDLQLEDWSEAYPGVFQKNATVSAYPVAVCSLPGQFSPKIGEKFRAQFEFDTGEQAKEAFRALLAGEKSLVDYAPLLWNKNYAPCLGGKSE